MRAKRPRPRRHVTIRDVARAAGVSVSTVSASINHTDYVSAAMRTRIQTAIERLHYRPNDLARGLRLQHTRTIAVVVPDLSNSFYTEIVQGLEDYAGAVNYTLLIGDSRERATEESKYLDSFHRRRVDGVVRIPAIDARGVESAAVLGSIPVVYADRFFRTSRVKKSGVGCVGVNNAEAAFDATRYLLGLGHRRIGIIMGPATVLTAAERLAGYSRALRSSRLSVNADLVRVADNQMLGGHREAIELLTRPDRPTAIFCTNNMMTLGALQAIQELKLKCPKHVSLLGFDDFYWATLLRPRITMVRQPAREIGMTAARVLIDFIEGHNGMKSEHFLPTTLMVRESCCPPPRRPLSAKERRSS
ncbi:MAG TPA: LacI family DNA-binding transcriptional regulator [Terriglobia bacterium]|nr:LacI family DNA-binding transcriptional regulator [Terriglobia bacterium]